MKKNIRYSLFIATMPLMIVSIIWVLTLGAFDYMATVHSEPMIACVAFFTVLGIIAFCANSQVEI